MRAQEIMSRGVIAVGIDASIVDAIDIMLAQHISGLPVVDPTGKLVGILSQGDFIRRAEIGTQRRRGRPSWPARTVSHSTSRASTAGRSVRS
jgi:CBS-domain-containing membrane protein